MISREDAAQIALETARANGLGDSLTQVLKLSQVKGRAPLVYGHDFSASWIAYVDTPDSLCLQSSTIVAIDQETGEVVYFGSAGDEG